MKYYKLEVKNGTKNKTFWYKGYLDQAHNYLDKILEKPEYSGGEIVDVRSI